MRFLMLTLTGLLASHPALAAETAEKLSYTERMGLYADWSMFLLLIIAIIALVRFWNK